MKKWGKSQAMSAKLDISGSVEAYLIQAEKNIKTNVDKAVLQSAFLVKIKAQKNIQTGQRSGKTYKRGKSGITGQRSAIGEFPKSDTGILARSITTVKKMQGVAQVGTDIKYGEYLENKDASNGGRPWLEPSFDQVEPKIKVLVRKAVKEGAKP